MSGHADAATPQELLGPLAVLAFASRTRKTTALCIRSGTAVGMFPLIVLHLLGANAIAFPVPYWHLIKRMNKHG